VSFLLTFFSACYFNLNDLGGGGEKISSVMFAVSINVMTKAVGLSVCIRLLIEDVNIQYTAVVGQGHKKMLTTVC
jgi:hypothetical protein